MLRRNPVLLALILAAGVIGMLVALTIFNYRYSRTNPGGNDFLVHYIGTRTFLKEGISPYSDETALRIQTAAYGHPAEPGQHELRVAYPLYSIVLFMPYALVSDYDLARALWMTTLEAALIAMALLSLRLTNWKPPLFMLTLFLLFSIFWYHAFRPLINGNAVILVALMIVGMLLALRSGADELAGVLLAFATIKPQVVLVLVIFMMVWSILQHRYRLLAWFFGTLFLLCVSAAMLMPDWILQNLREVMRYPGYNPPGTPGAAFTVWLPAMGQRLGYILTGVLVVLLVVEWFLARRAEYRGFLWTACFTLVVAQWIGVQTDPGNFIVTFPALVLVFAMLQERWRRGGVILNVFVLLLVFVGIWAVFLGTVQYGGQPQQSPVMFFPLPGLLLIMLFWVRWWAVRPPKVWFDMISDHENLNLR